MLVHRLLDAFFRTLDAVDAVRDRVDRLLGREPRPDPWAVEWPPPPAAKGEAHHEPLPNGEGAAPSEPPKAPKAPAPAAQAPKKAPERSAKKAPAKKARAKRAPAKKAPAAKRAEKTVGKSASTSTKPKPTSRRPASGSRKGSVDRQGKDFDSPRARTVYELVQGKGLGVVTEGAEAGGKKVLARVLWALQAADHAGSAKGLTTADVSALLHLSAGMEVFATNIGRACRDHANLIAETEPEGRSKRYQLTEEGRRAAAQVEVAPR